MAAEWEDLHVELFGLDLNFQLYWEQARDKKSLSATIKFCFVLHLRAPPIKIQIDWMAGDNGQ